MDDQVRVIWQVFSRGWFTSARANGHATRDYRSHASRCLILFWRSYYFKQILFFVFVKYVYTHKGLGLLYRVVIIDEF